SAAPSEETAAAPSRRVGEADCGHDEQADVTRLLRLGSRVPGMMASVAPWCRNGTVRQRDRSCTPHTLPHMNTNTRRLALSLCLPFCAFAIGAEGAVKDELLPRHAVKRLGTSAFRTGHHARSLAVSPDGKFLASSGFDTILLFDASTGHVLRQW